MIITKARIADLNVEFHATYYQINAICRPYMADFDTPDILIEISEDELMELYNKNYNYELPPEAQMGCGYCEGIIAFRKLNKIISTYDAFVFHGAAFAVNNKGIVLCALSGTGKTTHMLLWQQMLEDKFKIINGDKPIIRFVDGIPYAYGTPWNGKEHFGCNDKVELRDICFIERNEINEVVPVGKSEATQRISTQMVQPEDTAGIFKNMEFIDRLLNTCRTWVIRCNMEPQAAQVAYDTLYNK